MLQFLDRFETDILFPVRFTFSLVSYGFFLYPNFMFMKKCKLLITPYQELVEDFRGNFLTVSFFVLLKLKSHILAGYFFEDFSDFSTR